MGYKELIIRESYSLLLAALNPQFDPGEVNSIARILYEDLFGNLSPETSQAHMSSDDIAVFEDALKRLQRGEPIDYITGIREFYGRRFAVDPAVLIPRQETEELISWILDDIAGRRGFHILDIGTGSGCIPITLSLETKDKHTIFAVDVSKDALVVAKRNNEQLGANVTFDRVDILKEGIEQWSAMDLIISNPPYILSGERSVMNQQVLDHEPEIALFTEGDDPLVFYRRINQLALIRLKAGGTLYYEISALHMEAMVSLMRSDGFVEVECRKDISGNWRMMKATKP